MPLPIYLTIALVAILSIGAVICFVVLVPMSLMRGGQTRCLIVNCYSNPVGSAVPWATMVGTAQEAIAKHDKEALLQDVSVSTVAYAPPNWSYDKALKVRFQYVNPEADDITITMLDTSPTSTVEVEEREREGFGQSFYDKAAANKDQYARRLAGVKISPREAGELTWEKVKEYGDETKLYPRMRLTLDAESPYWYVSYSNVDKGLFDLWDMWFDVDARSGKIITANYEPFATQYQDNQTPATEL